MGFLTLGYLQLISATDHIMIISAARLFNTSLSHGQLTSNATYLHIPLNLSVHFALLVIDGSEEHTSLSILGPFTAYHVVTVHSSS